MLQQTTSKDETFCGFLLINQEDLQTSSTTNSLEKYCKNYNYQDAKNYKPLNYLIQDYLPLGLPVLLAGDAGTCKSLIAFTFALHVACGIDVFGKKVKQGKVLYITMEDWTDIMYERSLHILKNQKLDNDLIIKRIEKNLTICDMSTSTIDLSDEENLSELKEMILQNEYSLVIVDTLRRFDVEADENGTGEMTKVITSFNDLPHTTTLFLHHLNKKGGIRGTTSILGSVRNALKIERKTENEHDYRMYVVKGNYNGIGKDTELNYKLKFDKETGLKYHFEVYDCSNEDSSIQISQDEMKKRIIDLAIKGNGIFDKSGFYFGIYGNVMPDKGRALTKYNSLLTSILGDKLKYHKDKVLTGYDGKPVRVLNSYFLESDFVKDHTNNDTFTELEKTSLPV